MNPLRGLSCALFAVLAMLASVPAVAAPTAADFARHEQFRDAKLSPRGDYIAASAVIDGHVALSLIRLSDMKGVNVRARDSREIVDFWWVSPDRVMYTIGERFGALEAPSSTGELYAVDADGGSDGIVFGSRMGGQGASHIRHGTSRFAIADLIDPLLDDPRHALIAIYPVNGVRQGYSMNSAASGVFPEAALLDLRNGATKTVTISPLRDASFAADNHGVVRFAYGADVDQARKVWYRGGDGQDWTLLFDESKDGHRYTPLAFDRKGEAVYFRCDDGHGPAGLCVWNVATRKLDTLWRGEVAGVESLVPYFDGHGAIALRSMPDRYATTLIDRDAPGAKLLAALMQQFPGEDVCITSSALDGSRVTFFVSSDRDPGQFFLYDATTRKATALFARRPWIKPDEMAVMEPIALKARDGLALHGYLTRPRGKEDVKNLPLVVYVHGGPYFVRDAWDFDPGVQFLASRGYAVLQVNFRGSGGYGQAFEQKGYRQWGGAMQDDVTDATRWAIAQGIADPKRVCIYGASYGGYAALEGAEKEPGLYRCAIGYVGVYDLRLMYTRGDVPQHTSGENYLKRVLGEDEDELWERSPVAHADRIQAKVMLVVGGQDWRAPPVQSDAMRSALTRAHIEPEWLYQRTEGHGFYDEKHVEDLLTRVGAFLDANIGAHADAVASH